MNDQPILIPPDDPKAPHVVAKGIFDQFVDGITAVSIVTFVAYAIVFGFEEGFNAFFQLPSDFVAMNLLSVLHVFTLVAYVMMYDLSHVGTTIWNVVPMPVFEGGAIVAMCRIPARVYGRHPMKLATGALILYCVSTIFTPVVLLALAVAGCLWLDVRTKPDDVKRTRLFSRVGDGATKAILVFVLALTPLYYFGFRFAEVQTPRLVVTDTSGTWVVARVLGDSFVMVRLLNDRETVPQCVDQFDQLSDRPQRLSRSIHVIKDDVSPATWREFSKPLNYCLFPSEGVMSPVLKLTSLILIRKGLGAPSAEAQERASTPAPAASGAH